MKSTHFGMWIFLASEVMLFSGFFLAYGVYRFWYPAAFDSASAHLNDHLGLLNTVLLLLSSWCVARAVLAYEQSVRFLIPAASLGTVFLGIKFYEYQHKVKENLLPGFSEGLNLSKPEEIFMSLYLFGTGLHAFHLLFGIVAILAFCALRWLKKKPEDQALVRIGLYWHFVDIVWLFLYPLLYLIGETK